MVKPSRKVLSVLIFAVALVIAALLIKYRPFSFSTEKQADLKDLSVTTEKISAVEIDSDSDGLKDWEEILWKTDSKKSDSDNDGTNDGEEVKLGRDPSIKGPNDQIVEENTTGSFLKDTSSTTTSNLSQKFTTSFLSDFTYLESIGNINTETKAELIRKYTQNSEFGFLYKTYSLTDLLVDKNPSTESLKFYAESFATNQTLFLIAISEKQAAITKDITVLSSLYENLVIELVKIKVPVSIAPYHLKLINNYSLSAETFRALSQAKTDPVRAALGANMYSNIAQEHLNILNTLAKYFKQNGIIFSDEEIGGFWNIILSNQE